MAQRSRSKPHGSVDLLTWRPTPPQKKQLKAWLTSELDWVTLLLDYLHQGYKLSATYYSDGGAFFVTSTCRKEQSVNYGKALSVRHSDPIRAMGAILWLANEMPEPDWADIVTEEEADW